MADRSVAMLPFQPLRESRDTLIYNDGRHDFRDDFLNLGVLKPRVKESDMTACLSSVCETDESTAPVEAEFNLSISD